MTLGFPRSLANTEMENPGGGVSGSPVEFVASVCNCSIICDGWVAEGVDAAWDCWVFMVAAGWPVALKGAAFCTPFKIVQAITAAAITAMTMIYFFMEFG